ncbi:metalloregulator ArsR/SmtB family transcription factor [Pontiellaceae bacterium B12227]|nr:metalloregulator ArsR/SmtB family transcription factor [Pontiellaceae bacterium B12227]
MKAKELNCALENMTPESLTQASDMLRTLAHPARLQVIDLLHTAGTLPVGEIMDYLDLAQSAASQHLNHMRRTGLLKSERRGKEVWYSIADARPIALLNCLCKCCDRNL